MGLVFMDIRRQVGNGYLNISFAFSVFRLTFYVLFLSLPLYCVAF